MLKQYKYLWKVRSFFRSRFFDFLLHLAGIDDFRAILVKLVREQVGYQKPRELSEIKATDHPYPEIGRRGQSDRTCLRSDIIFVTGRFRSGSTLIWNLFRNIPGITSYYEPFNERRWFDQANRGLHVDPTHLKVGEYWAEYDGLAALGNYYSEDWMRRQLYMSARAWNPTMQRYIEILVESAKGRPVLQFNRVDFRLPWLRSCFPHTKIVHIFRHPRDQWCSTLGGNLTSGSRLQLQDFEQYDGFYLLTWGRDLRNYFPFLTLEKESHPYELFYQIWRLSYLFGRSYSSLSISLEEILGNSELVIERMLSGLSVEGYDLARLVDLVTPVSIGKWKQFADHQWFRTIEEKVDEQIAEYFKNESYLVSNMSNQYSDRHV